MGKYIPVEPEKWAEMVKAMAEVTRLKAELERLRASSFVTAVPVEEYEKLKAEVERLRKFNDEALAHIAKEERKSRERLDMAQAEVELLRKAGDAMAETILKDCIHKNDMAALKWYAANREQGCLVNPIKVAQYLPKPPTKEGKQP